MKKALLAALFLVATSAFAQKDQVWLAVGGDLFDRTLPKSGSGVTSISPGAQVRYMFSDKIGINGNVGLSWSSAKKAPNSAKLGVGGRYYYWGKDKMQVNGGVDVDLTTKGTVIDLILTAAELEYHPMENGALFCAVNYRMNDLGDAGANIGAQLGVKIRFK